MEKLKLNKRIAVRSAKSTLQYFMKEYPDCLSSMTYYKDSIDVSIHVEREGLKAETIMKEISDSLLEGYRFENNFNDALKYEVLHLIWIFEK